VVSKRVVRIGTRGIAVIAESNARISAVIQRQMPCQVADFSSLYMYWWGV
jgi:hypothetical protein